MVAEGISIPLRERQAGQKINVAMISAVAMKLLSKTAQPIAIMLYEINRAIKAETTKADWKKTIPAEYHDLLDLFDEKLGRELPPHRLYNHSIPLLDGKEPPLESPSWYVTRRTHRS